MIESEIRRPNDPEFLTQYPLSVASQGWTEPRYKLGLQCPGTGRSRLVANNLKSFLMPSTTTPNHAPENTVALPIHPITRIAAKLGIDADSIESYGRFKAKLPLRLIDLEKAKTARLILVSAVTPTPAGEGKTTTAIGIADGLSRIGEKAVVVLREPSLGPVFGMKGGATGGGKARVVPHEDINLHFNGDFSAIEKAHNLLAALVENQLRKKKDPIGLDPLSIRWKRVMDMNDRSLRKIIVGLGGRGSGIPREAGFDITAASEVMAILCMATSREDLKERLGNIFIGFTHAKKPVFARDIRAHGAMAALLANAVLPNLVQTLEGTPAIVHGGPFGNIAQGTNTVIATRMGLSLADWVVTEAGFGFDLGGEKFLDLKCRGAGLWPDAVALVATIRAAKYQGGVPVKELTAPDHDALRRGFPNIEKHIENVRFFGLEPVVVINRFPSDTDDEVNLLKQLCSETGAQCVTSDHFGRGGEGAEDAARVLMTAALASERNPRFAYELDASVEEKIETLATRIYGAGSIEFAPKARADLKVIDELGLDRLPICMAKTQYSFSDDPAVRCRPEGFTLRIREIEFAAGAGFLIPVSGELMRMPGLPEVPAAEHIDVDAEGNITGLS